MTDPYAPPTADRRLRPPSRPGSAPLRAWLLTGLVATAALTLVLAVRDDGPSPLDRAMAPVVVDGLHPVTLDGTTVTTPCFRYRVPEGLVLSSGSAGCATAVGVGEDDISEIQVRALTGARGDDIDEVAAEVRRALIGTGDHDIDTVTASGRDVVRIRGVDSWGLPRTSYAIPLPEGVFTQAGVDLDIIWLTSPSSPQFDGWVAAVLDSLEIAGA